MEEAKTMKTPMSSSIKLDKDEKENAQKVKSQIVDRVDQAVNQTRTSRPGKRPAELSQPSQLEARRKARFDTTLLSFVEDYQCRMGWLPVVTMSESIFPTPVQAFYLRATYGIGGPIISTIKRVKIRLDLESICRIFDIALVGLRGMGKPLTHNLTVISRVIHHMICSILLPRGGHRDEVSYYEAFLMDSISTERWIHLGYLMMMHMISCCDSMTRVLLYDRFLTRVFKDARVDLSRETRMMICRWGG
ncbi:hypothetical protein AAG906_028147 [Vitis piasezkii]